MFGISQASRRSSGIVLGAIGLGLLLTPVFAMPSRPRPENLDLSLEKPTEHQLFRVRIESGANPIPLSKMHQWLVHVSDAEGHPVAGATLQVDGGMPEHGHGLPTEPRAEAASAAGDYVVRGLKFSMTGWWELKVDVSDARGRRDEAIFNVVL